MLVLILLPLRILLSCRFQGGRCGGAYFLFGCRFRGAFFLAVLAGAPFFCCRPRGALFFLCCRPRARCCLCCRRQGALFFLCCRPRGAVLFLAVVAGARFFAVVPGARFDLRSLRLRVVLFCRAGGRGSLTHWLPGFAHRQQKPT